MKHRQARRLAILAFAIPALAVVLATTSACAAPGGPTVIVVSLDGVRHDYLDRSPFPALGRIAREGLRAGGLVPVFPASTFPGHVSLATGTYPDVHGIVDNHFWDRERGEFDYSNDAEWIQAEPLWAAAERQGVPTATFFWVGSLTDWNGVGPRYRVTPFDPGIGEAAKVERILAWLDLPAAERPRLVMTWWHGADHAGHLKGPDHADVVADLAAQDRQLGALLAGLDARKMWSRTTLVVVSDHGMTTAGATVPVRERLAAAGLRPRRIMLGSAVGHIFTRDAQELARVERALSGLPGLHVERRDALPVELRLRHPTRSGDLVLRVDPPLTFQTRKPPARATARGIGRRRGAHGYRPEHPDMAGIFLAMGRGVAAGARPTSVHMIDVAPSIAALLGIEPPHQSEGRPIPELGE